MNENLALKDLTEKLKQKKQREIEEIAEIEKQNLKEFMQSLKIFTSKELDTIKRDINQKNEHIKQAIQKATIESLREIRKEKEALKSELADIEDITTNLSHWKKVTLIPLIAPLIFLALIFLAFWGTLTYYKSEIAEQRAILADLSVVKPIQSIIKQEGILLKKGYKARVIELENGQVGIEFIKKD